MNFNVAFNWFILFWDKWQDAQVGVNFITAVGKFRPFICVWAFKFTSTGFQYLATGDGEAAFYQKAINKLLARKWVDERECEASIKM